MQVLRNIFGLAIILCSIQGCLEEIPLQTEVETFNSILVIEATITNEFVRQEIKLSRSYALEESGPSPEQAATVIVNASTGEQYSFVEDTPGLYLSVNEFAAQPNVDYYLEIETSNGRQYNSETASFATATQIDNLYLERNTNENMEEGVSIYVDTQDPTGNSKYYRYTYEETYVVIAPRYSPWELIVQNEDYPIHLSAIDGLVGDDLVEFFVTREFRPVDEELCYGSDDSSDIILFDASAFTDNAIERARVRFISRSNYIMSHRYSILVKQYVQSQLANFFYSALNSFSGSETIFSEVQAGFIPGNINALSNPDEPVVGFFEVSAYDEERIYFNYADLFPGEELPPYYIPCDAEFTPDLFFVAMMTEFISYSPLQDLVNDRYQYWDETENGPFQPYQLVLPACGDCTELGVTQVPDFWED